MAIQKFNYPVDMGPSQSKAFNVKRSQFGDGYAQIVPTGINNARTAWAGNKTGDLATVIIPIAAFLDAHAGYKPFTWTDPTGVTSQYICAGYTTSQRKGNIWQIALQFEQFIHT